MGAIQKIIITSFIIGTIIWIATKKNNAPTFVITVDPLLNAAALTICQHTVQHCQENNKPYSEFGTALLTACPALKKVSWRLCPGNKMYISCCTWRPALKINNDLVLLANGIITSGNFFTHEALQDLPSLTIADATLEHFQRDPQRAQRLLDLRPEVFERYNLVLTTLETMVLHDKKYPELRVQTTVDVVLSEKLQRACDYLAQTIKRPTKKKQYLLLDARFKDQIVVSMNGGSYERNIIF
jgi:hypothetical protein